MFKFLRRWFYWHGHTLHKHDPKTVWRGEVLVPTCQYLTRPVIYKQCVCGHGYYLWFVESYQGSNWEPASTDYVEWYLLSQGQKAPSIKT